MQSRPESELVAEAFYNSIDRLSKSSNTTISALSKNIYSRMGKEIFIVIKADQQIRSMVSFNLQNLGRPEAPNYVGGIVVNLPRFSVLHSSRPQIMLAELVPALYIADQFPDRGFARRLKTVYAEALNLQAQWLEEEGLSIPEVLDPRNVSRDLIIKSLLGSARYVADTGFGDFLRIIGDYEKNSHDLSEIIVLNELRLARSGFIARRENYANFIHDIVSQVPKDNREYQESDEQGKAEMIAGYLLGLSLINTNTRKDDR